jgi:predicted HTH domain antitoxin
MALLNIDKLKKAGADALSAAKKSGTNALEAAKKSAKEASDLASQKAKEASEKASQIAKETSEKASQAAKEAKEKASQAAKEASEWATQTAKDVTLWAQENENIQNAISKGKQAYLFVSDKTTNAVQIVGNKFAELKDDEQVIAAWEKASEVAGKVGQTSVKGLKVISGVQAVQDRKKSIQTKEEADALKAEVEATNEAVRDDMNEALEEFGKRRLEALHNTVGVFLEYLNRLNQRSKAKEYEFLTEIEIKQEEISELKQIDMKASDAVKVLAVGGGFATIGLIGTPFLVSTAVASFAAASTGTAISALSGAAATNAVLAWLGGGAIAAGGGGMAAGAAVMTALTATATVGLAVIAVGTLASAFYARKYTEATQYLADIQEWVAQTEASWTVMAGIKQRVLELQNITSELEERAIAQLHKLDPYIDHFDNSDMAQVQLFQQAAIMVKSMSELAQVSVLDEDGNLNERANIVAAKTEKILNTSL